VTLHGPGVVLGSPLTIAIHRRGTGADFTGEDSLGNSTTATGTTALNADADVCFGTIGSYAPKCTNIKLRWVGVWEPALTAPQAAAWLTYLGTL
jgi:hypothetical protein